MFPFDYLSSHALPPAFQTQLAGGTAALVRHIRPEDAPRLKDGFKSLSALARGRHFPGQNLTELGDEQLKLLAQVDQKNYVIWGALNPGKSDEPGIGIARYKRLDHEPSAADVLITVLDRYQGSGAGLLLHSCLHATARQNGIRWFYYDVPSENERFIRHLKSLGAEFQGRVVGLTRLKLPVFARALSVPQYNASGLKFSQMMRKLASVQAVAA